MCRKRTIIDTILTLIGLNRSQFYTDSVTTDTFVQQLQQKHRINIIEMFATSPSWSMPGKYEKTKPAQTPSPWGYNPHKVNQSHAPSWKIGTSDRNKQNNSIVPGPGEYETMKQSPTAKLGKFGHQNHHKVIQNNNPSPSNYSPNFKYNRPASPFLTIAAKTKQLQISKVPGPGTYEANFNTKNNLKNVKIGEQKRFVEQKLVGPGPQAYTPVKNNFKKISIGFAKENHQFSSCHQQQIKVPGPGSYASTDIFSCSLKEKKGFSISSKHKPAPEDQIPGPGQYSPTFTNFSRSPKVSMKGSHKTDKVQQTPGPQQYFFTNQRKSNSGYSIGKEQRVITDYCKNNPGPGAYDPKKIYSQTPKFSLYGSRIQENKDEIPGPGSYNPNKLLLKRRPQSAKIGKSKRNEAEKQNIPGPGAYEIKSRPPSPCTFKKQDRMKKSCEETPGPGQYNIQPLLGQTPTYWKQK